MDVRRHLAALRPGAGPGLAMRSRSKLSHQGRDDDDGRDEEHRPPDGAQGGSDPCPETR